MTGMTIRVRLALWHAAAAAVSTAVLIGAGWWLLQQSVRESTDARIAQHLDGVRTFAEGLPDDLSTRERQEEYGEYSGLSLGDALIEVRDASGESLHQPVVGGWSDAARHVGAGPHAARPVVLQGRPFRMRSDVVVAHGQPLRVVVAVPTGPALDALAHLRRVSFWMLPLSMLLAAAVGYAISTRALQPIDRMTREVRAIHVGALDRRLATGGADDEVRRLAVTFNEMLGGLEQGVEQIARFTADASHELRTPVALVGTTAELALRRDRSGDEYRAALGEIHGLAQQMGTLVEDLLSTARADAGVDGRDAERPHCDAGAVLSAEAQGWVGRAARAGLTCDVVVPHTPVFVSITSEHLRRLAGILVDNAIRYTPAPGRVRVALEPGASGVRLVVEDDGIGIGPEDQPRLFSRFFRGERARALSAEGHGLGLSIAHGIVTRYGAAMSIAAAAPVDAARPGTRVTVDWA